MSDKLKNILIGLFALLAILITIAVVLFLKPSIGDGKKTLNVRFSNIQGLTNGSRVTFAGRPVGEVVQITEVKNAREDKKDEFGRFYFYQLTLKIDSSIEVYNTDSIAVQITGLMGEKSIGISPKAPKKGEKIYQISDEIIYANSVDSFENTARQITELADKFDITVDNFNNWFEKNSQNITSAVSSISSILNDANENNLVGSINNSMNSFTNSMNSVNSVITQAQDEQMFTKLNVLIDNLAVTSSFLSTDGKDILNNFKQISDNLASSNKTLGKFINGEDFYLNLNAILSKANTLMNDINQYGFLFQYSKGWQRQRIKRSNIIEALNSPKEFKSYFEKEIDEITVCLERINTLVAKSKETKQKDKVISSEAFKNDFGSLLRQVNNLLDMIKLYNEDLFDKEKVN
ncbi:MAG: MCE family protein [Parachlamydiales bacterium]|nr:MCE family protein [Parachlamydiales bacterium]